MWSFLNPESSASIRFCHFQKVVEMVMFLPQSNVGVERLFSMVHKNKIDNHSFLKLEGNPSNLLAMKWQYPEASLNWAPTHVGSLFTRTRDLLWKLTTHVQLGNLLFNVLLIKMLQKRKALLWKIIHKFPWFVNFYTAFKELANMLRHCVTKWLKPLLNSTKSDMQPQRK